MADEDQNQGPVAEAKAGESGHGPVKLCRRCQEYRPCSEYHRLVNGKLWGICKDCFVKSQRDYQVRQAKGELLIGKEAKKKIQKIKAAQIALEDQAETVKRIVAAFIENPRATLQDVAAAAQVSVRSLAYYVESNAYLKAMRFMARNKMTRMLPKAIKGFEESLESVAPQVKFNSATRLLESEGALGPNKIEVDLNDLRKKSVEELRRIVEEAKVIPAQVLETELIS